MGFFKFIKLKFLSSNWNFRMYENHAIKNKYVSIPDTYERVTVFYGTIGRYHSSLSRSSGSIVFNFCWGGEEQKKIELAFFCLFANDK